MRFQKNFLAGLCLIASAAGYAGINSTGADGYLARGKAMYNQGNYAGAIDQLSHLKRMPVSSTVADCADFYIAMSNYERGNRESLDALRAYLAQHPSDVNAARVQAAIADYYFYNGKYGEAITEYDKVRIAALDGDASEDVYYRRAYSLLRLGEYEQALVNINALRGSRRYAAANTFYQAYVDYANKRYGEALTKFQRVKGNGELAYNAQYYVAQIYFTQQQYDKAETLAKSLLSDGNNPAFNAELCRIIGECEYQDGNDDEAEKYLKRYLDTTAGEPLRSAAYAYGVIRYRADAFDEAVNSLATMTTDSDALSQSAYLYIGQSYLKLHELNKASIAFEKAIQLDYDRNVTETAFYNYAITQNEGGRTPFNKSIDIFEQFINKYPNSRYATQVEEYLINAYLTTTDYDKAYTSISHIKNPSDKVLAAKQYVLYQLGVQALSNNATSKANTYFTQALALEKYDRNLAADTRLWLGETNYRLGKYALAQKYQKAFLGSVNASNKNYGLGNYNLGYSLFQQKQYGNARSYFEHAATSKQLGTSLRADAYNRLADCQYYTKQYAAAEGNYEAAYNLDRNTAGDYALYQKAIMKGLTKDYSGKIAAIDNMLKQFPSSSLAAGALLEKANTYAVIDNNAAAADTYNELLRRYPQTVEARKGLLQLAINQRYVGEESKAIATYKQVITKYPTSEEAAVAAEDLKVIYADNGNLREYASFINSVPNAPHLDVKEVEKLTFNAAEKAALAEKSSIKKMENYLSSYPNGAYEANAHYYIGRDCYQKAEYDKALTHINQALRATDASFAEDALAIKSDILMKQDKNTEALDTYRRLAEKASSHDNKVIANLGIMRANVALKQWTEVKNSAATLLSLGSLSDAEEKEATLNRAIANAHLGNTKEAEADYSVLAKDVRSESGARAAYELAKLQYEAGSLKTCEKTLNKFIDEGTPHQYWLAKAFILLADVYHKQGNDFEAREYLESLKSNYPGKEQDIFDDIEQRLKSWKSSKK